MDSTPEQDQKTLQFIGVCRFLFNKYVGRNLDLLKLNQKKISANQFDKYVNHELSKDHPWVQYCGSKARKKSLVNAETAFKRYYSHHRMVFKSPSYIQNEIEKTDQLIRDAGYKGEILFRPPNGKKFVLLPYYLSEHNRKTIMWDIEPDSYDDIASNSEKIVKHVETNPTEARIHI